MNTMEKYSYDWMHEDDEEGDGMSAEHGDRRTEPSVTYDGTSTTKSSVSGVSNTEPKVSDDGGSVVLSRNAQDEFCEVGEEQDSMQFRDPQAET